MGIDKLVRLHLVTSVVILAIIYLICPLIMLSEADITYMAAVCALSQQPFIVILKLMCLINLFIGIMQQFAVNSNKNKNKNDKWKDLLK